MSPSNMYTFCQTINYKFAIEFKSLEADGNAISLLFLIPLLPADVQCIIGRLKERCLA